MPKGHTDTLYNAYNYHMHQMEIFRDYTDTDTERLDNCSYCVQMSMVFLPPATSYNGVAQSSGCLHRRLDSWSSCVPISYEVKFLTRSLKL